MTTNENPITQTEQEKKAAELQAAQERAKQRAECRERQLSMFKAAMALLGQSFTEWIASDWSPSFHTEIEGFTLELKIRYAGHDDGEITFEIEPRRSRQIDGFGSRSARCKPQGEEILAALRKLLRSARKTCAEQKARDQERAKQARERELARRRCAKMLREGLAAFRFDGDTGYRGRRPMTGWLAEKTRVQTWDCHEQPTVDFSFEGLSLDEARTLLQALQAKLEDGQWAMLAFAEPEQIAEEATSPAGWRAPEGSQLPAGAPQDPVQDEAEHGPQ